MLLPFLPSLGMAWGENGIVFVYSILLVLFILYFIKVINLKAYILLGVFNLILFTVFKLATGKVQGTENLIFFIVTYLFLLMLLYFVYFRRNFFSRDKFKREKAYIKKLMVLKISKTKVNKKVDNVDREIENILNIYDLNKEFEKIQKLEDALKVFSQFFKDRYETDRYFFIFKKEDESDVSFEKISNGFNLEHSKISSINPKNLKELEQLFYSDKAIFCKDFSKSKKYHQLYVYFPAAQFVSIPIVSEDLGVGLYVLFSNPTKPVPRALKKEMDTLVQLINGILRKTLLYVKMEQLSEIDGLTKIYSRGYFNKKLEDLISTDQKGDKCFSLSIFDIDFFKSCNDNYGHQFGDYVLRKLSDLVSRSLSDKEIFARYGGEEFVIIFPGLTKKYAEKILEDIRKTIEDYEFNANRNFVKLTVSFGLSQFPEDGADSKSILKTADKALYQAKNTGRNRVVVFDRDARDEMYKKNKEK